ncbi:MAG: extracellular solute-binding protein, partial [Planctomycetota bacterium]
SWVNDLQDYYGMPMSIFTIRVFANADLLSEATGLSKKELRALVGVPTAGDLQEAAEGNSDGTGPGRPDFTLSDFFAMCEQIKQLARDKGDEGSIVPIAGSKYIAQIFQNRYFQMAFWGLRPDLDLDYNGSSSTAERIRAIFTGRLNLETNPQVAAAHKLLYEISRQFNPGFAQSDRDLSVFLFTQGKAAMIATGSWEAGTLYGIVGGEFDILVFDFPLAGPDSKYAEYIQERISEAGLQAGFAMGLTKHSTHKAEAVDFMHFLTSRRINEQLNKRFKWFPAIRGAGTVPELTNFRPKVEGIWKVFEMHVGSDTLREYEQAYQGFIGKEHIRSLDAHFQQFIEGYEKKFGQLALSDFQKGYRARYDRITQMERQAADARMRVIRADKEIDQLDPVLRRNLVSLVAGSAGAKVTREQEQALVEQVREQTGGNIQKQSPSQPEDRP